MEKEFWETVQDGHVEEVKRILRNTPNLDVNWTNPELHLITPIHLACNTYDDVIVSILLAHPDINVNMKDKIGRTPFRNACYNGHLSCVRLLLKDPRVKVNARR